MGQIHTEELMFQWITKDHKIVVSFKHLEHEKCNICGKRIPTGNTIYNPCFEKEKK